MAKSAKQFAGFQVRIAQESDWSSRELDALYKSIALLASIMGGRSKFTKQIGDVVIERTDTGTHLGLAYHDRIQLSAKAPFSSWSVIHELAHVWDAKHDWKLSLALQKYTKGFTNRFLSGLKRYFMPAQWDAGAGDAANQPGGYGRKPGCNLAGYFYGDRPSGSNWSFNRKEDFAESVVMYCGWGRKNELSKTAHGRIERYLLPNGKKDSIYHVADNWSDYAEYFYPEKGDYTKTKRWRFVRDLIKNKIEI